MTSVAKAFDPGTVLLAKHAQHVVLVHFPIALFITGVALGWAGRWTRREALAQAGYYSGELTAKWDDKTIDSLKKFQAANNLPVTGTLDPETIRKLGLDVVTPKPQ